MQVTSSASLWTEEVISGLPLPGNTCDTRQLLGGRPQNSPPTRPRSGILSVARFRPQSAAPGISKEFSACLPRVSPSAGCQGKAGIGLEMLVESSASPWTDEVISGLPPAGENM